MPSTITDRLFGLTTSVALKAACRVATTAAITLSGVQTIDGVLLVAGDRVLVKDQASAADNGIWICSANTWSRAADFDGTFDAVRGTLVYVYAGSVNSTAFWEATTPGAIVVGTDDVEFVRAFGGLVAYEEVFAPATAGQTVFTLPFVPTTQVIVFANGVRLIPSDFDVSGATLTLVDPRSAGDTVVAVLGDVAGQSSFFSHSTSYAAGTAGKKLQQHKNPLDAPYSAVGNGTTDDRTALFNADAAGPVTITANHRVSSNLTFTNDVIFSGNGRLTIDTGIVVTFSGQVTAARRQIFYGLGTAANLLGCQAEWFIGDLKNTATNAWVLFKKAVAATVGVVYCGQGAWAIDTTDDCEFGSVSFSGNGRSEQGTVFKWLTSKTYGFAFTNSGTRGGFAKGFRFEPYTPGTIPTEGLALYVNQSDRTVTDYHIKDAYNAAHFDGAVINRTNDFEIIGARQAGFHMEDMLDFFVRDYNIEALGDWVTLSSVSGTFVEGENFTCASGGSSGTISTKYSATTYRMTFQGEPPTPSTTTITGTTSGATATFSTITVGHQQGGIRLTGTSEGCSINDGDTLGGEYGLSIGGVGTAGRLAGNSGFLTIGSDALFDTTYSGSTADGLYGSRIDAWFSTTRKLDQPGLSLVRARSVRGSPHLVNNAGAGIQWDNTCEDVEWTAIDCDANCRNFTGALTDMADIRVLGAATRWRIIGGRAGQTGLSGTTPPLSLSTANAAGDQFKVIGLSVPGSSVSNLATGADQEWWGVSGMPDRSPATKYVDAVDDAAAATALVPVGGHYRNGSIQMIRVA